MITCKEASRLLSLSLDRPLPVSRRLALKAHVSVCEWCGRYGIQLKLLRRWLRSRAVRVSER